MKERPILMSGPLVRAVLEGRKTQTRRVVKGMALDWLQPGPTNFTPEYVAQHSGLCPYGQVGDRLYVRETFAILTGAGHRTVYRADGEPTQAHYPGEPITGMKWTPSIHMPRWASRLSLVISDVRVERLQDISEEDAKAEGVERVGDRWRDYITEREAMPTTFSTALPSFLSLWESVCGTASLAANPWVWAISFEVAS